MGARGTTNGCQRDLKWVPEGPEKGVFYLENRPEMGVFYLENRPEMGAFCLEMDQKWVHFAEKWTRKRCISH